MLERAEHRRANFFRGTMRDPDAHTVPDALEAQALATTFQQQHRRGQIVISCAVGYRSSEMAAQLTRAGIENVSNVEGGRRALAHLRGRSRR